MAENGHLIAYLLVEKGTDTNKRTYWRPLGAAYPCRDGSLNLKLDIHPGLTFNLRPPKSNGEREETETEAKTEEDDRVFPCDKCKKVTSNEEAHATSDGAVVCESCFQKHYKDCGRCTLAFPKSIKGSHCSNC